MITEYTNTSTTLPHHKWYIVYNEDDKEIVLGLSKQVGSSTGITIATGCKLALFDSEEEGKTYILDNSLITQETINNNIFNE